MKKTALEIALNSLGISFNDYFTINHTTGLYTIDETGALLYLSSVDNLTHLSESYNLVDILSEAVTIQKQEVDLYRIEIVETRKANIFLKLSKEQADNLQELAEEIYKDKDNLTFCSSWDYKTTKMGS